MRKILAIDDKLDNLTTIKAVVKMLLPKIEVLTARSGKQGIEMAKNYKPDAILLDIIMPEMDGFEVCEKLKKEVITKNIPIMMVTALNTDPESKVKALEIGADAFVTKPFEPVELIAQLKVILRTKEAEDNLREERNNLKQIVEQRTKKLKENELKYRSLVESSQEPILVIQKGIVKFTNTITTTLSGYKNEELEGSSFIEYLHKDDQKIILRRYEKRIEGDEPKRNRDFRIINKSGKVLWFSYKVNDVEWGEEKAFQYILNDITEKKEIEKQKRINDERDKVLLELYNMSLSANDKDIFDFVIEKAVTITQSKIGFFHKFNEDLNTINLTAWNNQAVKHCDILRETHYPLEKAGNWVDCVREKKIIIYNDYSNSPNQQGLPEGHVTLKNFMSIPVILMGKIFYIFGIGNKEEDYNDTDKQNLKIIANELSKILEKRKNEEEIKRSTEKYLAIHNNAPLPFQSLNREGNIVEVNPAWLETLGYKRDEILGRWYGDFLHEDYIVSFKNNLAKLKDEGEVHDVFFKIKDKNGEYIDIKIDGTSGYDSKGEFIQTYSTFKNVTEEIKQQNKLEESEAKYRSFAEHFEGIAFKGYDDFSLDFMNGKVESITGYKEQDFISGRIKFQELIHPGDRKRVDEQDIEFSNSNLDSIKRKYRIRTKSNEIKWLHESISKFQEKNRKGVYGTYQDITAEVASLEQIQFQSEILHNLSEGILIVDIKNSQILYSNFIAQTMFGYGEDKLIGQNINSVFSLTVKQKKEIRSELNKNKEWSGEVLSITKSGDSFCNYLKIREYDHPVLGSVWIGSFEDISEKKHAEKQFSEQRQYLETIHNNAPVSFWIFERRNGKYYFIYQNKTATQYINVSEEELIGNELSEIVPDIFNEEGLNDLLRYFGKVVKTKKPVTTRGPMEIKGKIYYWLAVYSPLFNEKGEVYRIISASISIDEQIQKENELLESEFKNRRFLEHFQGIAFQKNTSNLLDLIEGNVTGITGYKSQDFLGGGINFDLLIHPEDLQAVKREDKDFIESSKTKHNSEFRLIDKNGSIHWIYETTTKYTINDQTGIYGTLQDITQLKEASILLEELNNFNKSLIDTIPFPIQIVDESGVVLFINPVLGELVGKEMVGKKCWLLEDDRLQCTNCSLKEGIKLGITNKIEASGVLNKRSFEITHRSMLFEGKKAMMEIFVDITRNKIFEGELIEARNKAVESDKLKSAFLANMSHEIRTPMNGILGFLDLLQDASLPQCEKEQFMDIMRLSGDRLLNTINDIIELSKIESDEMSTIYSEQNLNHCLMHLYEFFSVETNKKGIELSIEKVDVVVKTDFSKLDSILTNLIKNAIKFTDKGSITVNCQQINNKLQFSVKDTGIGIASNKLKMIFGRFSQADNTLSRGYEGSGLGLSICKGYTNVLGGDIWVDSVLGKGSTFYFTIDYESTVTKQKNSTSANQLKVGTPVLKGQILVAEDDEMSFLLLKAYLEKTDLKIIHAKNGEEAIQKLKGNPLISIVLMDLKMPVLDGLAATKRIRLFNKDIPIIAQTAFALLGDRDSTLDAGCTDYLSKPIKKHQLIQILKKYLNSQKQ